MRATVTQELNRLFSAAEDERSCVAAASDRLRRAIRTRGDEFVQVTGHLYARRAYWDGLNRPQQVMHILKGIHDEHPDWVLCGPSAAAVWGMSVSYALLDEVHVATSRRAHSRGTRSIRRHVVDEERVEWVRGLPVTPADRTVLDCMRWASFADGLAIADSALRAGLLTHDELVSYTQEHARGLHGAAQARMTSEFSSPLPENGGESIARATMHELGFAAPELQVWVPSPFVDGPRSWRVDYCWTLEGGRRVFGELDGAEKYENALMNGGSPTWAMRRERRRESRLTVTHASIARFSPDEVADLAYFNDFLLTFGIPKDHEPLVKIPELARFDQVPLEAYEL